MGQVPTPDWKSAYDAFLARLPGFVAAAPLTLCGMGACVDVRISMHDVPGLLGAQAPAEAVAFAAVLMDRVEHGVGGEIAVDWPMGPRFFTSQLPIRTSLGGTGPQAAWVLACAGAPALVALEDRSASMLEQLDPRMLLAENGRPTPAAQVRPRGVPGPEVFIFEYTAGLPIGEVVPKRSSRIIVRFADKGLEHDPGFDRLSTELAASCGSAVISGFNSVPTDRLADEIAHVRRLAGGWRSAGLRTIHLELAGYTTAAARDAAIDGLRGCFTSIGMSHSEYRDLSRIDDLADGLVDLGERLDIDRVCVHADHWAATATRGDPAREADALMMGCLLSSSRAASGHPVLPTDIDARAAFHPPPFPAALRRGAWTLVSCASPYLDAPATTLGLGDSFTAGCLLVLGQSSAGMSLAHRRQA